MPYKFVERIKENDLNGSEVSDSQQKVQKERKNNSNYRWLAFTYPLFILCERLQQHNPIRQEKIIHADHILIQQKEGGRRRIHFSNMSSVSWATYKSIFVRTFLYAHVNIFDFLNIYFPLFYYYYYCYCYYCFSPLTRGIHRFSNWFRLYHLFIYYDWMKYVFCLLFSVHIISLPHVMWRWRRCWGKIENTGRLLTIHRHFSHTLFFQCFNSRNFSSWHFLIEIEIEIGVFGAFFPQLSCWLWFYFERFHSHLECMHEGVVSS